MCLLRLRTGKDEVGVTSSLPAGAVIGQRQACTQLSSPAQSSKPGDFVRPTHQPFILCLEHGGAHPWVWVSDRVIHTGRHVTGALAEMKGGVGTHLKGTRESGGRGCLSRARRDGKHFEGSRGGESH